MGDAEIIPIGTRGRPGRGTGTQPSSAARGLAPSTKPAPKKATPAGSTAARTGWSTRSVPTTTIAPWCWCTAAERHMAP